MTMQDPRLSLKDGFDRFAAAMLPPALPARLPEELRALARPLALARKRAFALDANQDHLVFLISGAIKLVAGSADGAEQVLSFKFGGDCIHVPRARLHSFSLVALRRCELLLFPASEVQALAAQHAAFGKVLYRCSLEALYHCRETLLTMGRRGATERVSSFLLAMRDIRQVASSDGRMLTLLMTRREIAECLGLTVETVSRQFSKLRDLGVIDTPSRTQVTLHDPARLVVLAGGLDPGSG